MDVDWARKQLSELERLMGERVATHQIKFGTSLIPDHEVGAMIDLGFTSLDRIPEGKKCLLDRIKELEDENKALKHKLVMQVLRYKGKEISK